jgi:predicted adenine nucleotide alpha hydrolase (AANH) superfamily ATPase
MSPLPLKKTKMMLLLHICCAPCSCYPYRKLTQEGMNVRGFFYNPNIQPYIEYQKRLQAVKQWANQEQVQIIYRDEYPLEEFLRSMAYREGERCRICYHQRLIAAACAAKRGKFDAFSTTLLYSIHQKHELIKELGQCVAKQYGVEFYYQDFRPGWREGILLSKQWNLYRQQYCGCIYSEWERYQVMARSKKG